MSVPLPLPVLKENALTQKAHSSALYVVRDTGYQMMRAGVKVSLLK